MRGAPRFLNLRIVDSIFHRLLGEIVRKRPVFVEIPSMLAEVLDSQSLPHLNDLLGRIVEQISIRRLLVLTYLAALCLLVLTYLGLVSTYLALRVTDTIKSCTTQIEAYWKVMTKKNKQPAQRATHSLMESNTPNPWFHLDRIGRFLSANVIQQNTYKIYSKSKTYSLLRSTE